MKKNEIILTTSVFTALIVSAAILWWRLTVGCNVWEAQCVFLSPKIQLTANTVQGKVPLKVEFTVTANGIPLGHPLYYCHKDRFENGITTIEGFPQCTKRKWGDPEIDTQIRTYDYTYKESGVYTAQYHIMSGNTTVRASSNTLTVTVEQ